MEPVQVVILSLIQGLTEFLPISSSAHLLLPSQLLGWPDQGVLLDVAMHVGTLAAVIIYFRKDIGRMLTDSYQQVRTGQVTEYSKMAGYLVSGTIPAVLFGGILTLSGWDEMLRAAPWVLVAATLIFAVLLLAADLTGRQKRNQSSISLRDALIIGLAQAVALIPGTSRSGITLTAGLWLGLTREAAARFSFLLSVPVIAMAGGLKIIQLLLGDIQVEAFQLLLAVSVSGISAYLCIHLFLSVIERMGLLPFVIYRLILGGALAWLLISG